MGGWPKRGYFLDFRGMDFDLLDFVLSFFSGAGMCARRRSHFIFIKKIK